MRKKVMLLALIVVSFLFAGTFPNETGIILTDLEGKTYDIDALLNDGKHILVHQMFAG